MRGDARRIAILGNVEPSQLAAGLGVDSHHTTLVAIADQPKCRLIDDLMTARSAVRSLNLTSIG